MGSTGRRAVSVLSHDKGCFAKGSTGAATSWGDAPPTWRALCDHVSPYKWRRGAVQSGRSKDEGLLPVAGEGVTATRQQEQSSPHNRRC